MNKPPLTDIIKVIEYLGQVNREQRLKNLISLIGVPYEEQHSDEGLCNIIIPAKTKVNQITISSHWDNYPNSNGYNDNASGMSVLLNLQHDLPDNVELVFTDQEEAGGRGSQLYLIKNDPILNLNIDVVGYGDKLFYDTYYGDGMFRTIYGDRPSVVLKESMAYHPNVPFNDSYIFQRSGVDSILFISGNSNKEVVNEIWSRQHGGKFDNDLTQLNPKCILQLIEILNKFFKSIGDSDESTKLG